MKTREDVIVRSYLDGTLTDTHVENRMVYARPDGTRYIRVTGGKESLTSDNPAVVERRGKTIKSLSLSDIIATKVKTS